MTTLILLALSIVLIVYLARVALEPARAAARLVAYSMRQLLVVAVAGAVLLLLLAVQLL